MISLLEILELKVGEILPIDYDVKPGDILGWPTNKHKLLIKWIDTNGMVRWAARRLYDNEFTSNIGDPLVTNDRCHRRTVYHGFEPLNNTDLQYIETIKNDINFKSSFT
jgi:hypothetical protein